LLGLDITFLGFLAFFLFQLKKRQAEENGQTSRGGTTMLTAVSLMQMREEMGLSQEQIINGGA
jgi:hypothetical protein